jgi:hypothetical protein
LEKSAMLGILIPLLLQHGCDVGTIARALSRNGDGSASRVAAAVLDYERLKALNADAVEDRFGPKPDDDRGFFESACHGMLLEEDYWRQCNLVWAWIDAKPVWVSAANWKIHILPEPQRPCVRRFRLSLIGGGQIRVAETFVDWKDWPGHVICYQPNLRVQAETANGLRTYNGIISDGATCEMATYAALFLPKTPQDIVDRTAATLRLINNDADNFYALLARGGRCCVCRRPLQDHLSKLLDIGPDCAKQMRLPHNLKAANRILQRRKELLGSGSTDCERAHR